MALTFICIPFLVVSLTNAEGVPDGPISLDVTVSGTLPQAVSVMCSLEPSLVSMDTVDSLRIYGSKPNSKKQDLQTLASVDRWDSNPRLLNSLSSDDVSVDGFLGFGANRSELVLSWTSPSMPEHQRFKCSARGIDQSGQTVTISELVNVNSQQFCHATNLDPIVDKIDNFAVPFNNMNTVLNKVENRLDNLNHAFNDSSHDRNDIVLSALQGLQQEVNRKLDKAEKYTATHMNDFSQFLNGLSDTMQSLQQALDSQASRMKSLEARHVFDVSGEFRGKHYLASKQASTFNITEVDKTCESYGGYIAEIDDQAENDFVFNFVKTVGPRQKYAVGNNDIDEEGKYVFYHSKKPVVFSKWIKNEPNNDRGNEDCVGIYVQYDGLNDFPCDHVLNFICEVKL
ncbi:hypothetical protein EGW08_008976 [Elysia chlorotica]|uniref:C-type lectin domain-containing protein n=1 Tax=Elysia chlorotica TaxID=188477 RepID=A0A3S1B9X2_ELYCH|nr:hypothetical protein EGW08_008976 [Elysia chlorotica]